MIEERGRVVRIEASYVWVETQRQSACGECLAETTCGHGLMNRLLPSRSLNHVRASCDFPVNVNDEVTIALPEQALLSASFLVYFMPLLALFAALLVGELLQLPELFIILLSLGGLASGFLGVRWWTHRITKGRYEPVVLYRHVPLAIDVTTRTSTSRSRDAPEFSTLKN